MSPILLLHGGALNKEMWTPLIRRFGSGYEVHVIDLLGHGENIDVTFSLDGSVKKVHSYIESNMDGRAIVVGLSLGGYVAMAYAERYSKNIVKLVLSGCCIQYRGIMGVLAKITVFFLQCISHQRFESMNEKQLLKITSPAIVKQVIKAGISRNGARDSMEELVGKDFSRIIEHCKVPILLANGEFDKLNRKYEISYTEVCQKLTVITISGCGHLCSLEQPDIFAAMVTEFVDRENF